jgi:hypothetical protein
VLGLRRLDIQKATFSWKNAAAKSKNATLLELTSVNWLFTRTNVRQKPLLEIHVPDIQD